MSVTGISILDVALLSVGVTNTRYGSSLYGLVSGVLVSTLPSGRIRFETGFSNHEPIRGATHPDIKSQIVDMNANGSSAIVYSNKPGVSSSMIQNNRIDHWYKAGEWKAKLQLGSSMSINDFYVSGISNMPITLY